MPVLITDDERREVDGARENIPQKLLIRNEPRIVGTLGIVKLRGYHSLCDPSPGFGFPPLGQDNELEDNDYAALINLPRPFSRATLFVGARRL